MMDKFITLEEAIKLIEFIETARFGYLSGDITQDIYSSIEGAIKEAKDKLKNSQLFKLIEKCPAIPVNRQVLFMIDLYKIADMYRLNEGAKNRDAIYSEIDKDYLKQIKKEVAAVEVAKGKQTDYETIESLNRIIETKNTWIENLSESKPDKNRPVDKLKHGLVLSFKRVWNSHSNSEKMDATAYDLAAQFFCELGYKQKK